MSIPFEAPSMSVLFLILTFNRVSSAVHLDGLSHDRDYCTELVTSRVVKPGVDVPTEELYFCHPSISNAYLKCVVGKPDKPAGKVLSTEVLEEQELVCGVNGFFNSQKKACMPHPLSDCASKFVQRRPTDEQRICEAYRMSRPVNYSPVASLICHDKEKRVFVVCPVNAASAVAVPCANGTYFSQAKGQCVKSADESDCPIEWKEMERENTLRAGEMRQDDSKCQCICKAKLSSTRDGVAYVAHPDDDRKFLICARNGQIHGGVCPPPLFWNDVHEACDYNGYRKPVSGCGGTLGVVVPKPTTAQTTTTCSTLPLTTTTTQPSTPPPTHNTAYCQYYYEFHPEKMNWYSAKRVCEANHGTLATITDLNTQSLLRDRYGSTSKSKRLWIGASDRNKEGNWRWVTGERFGFTNWYRNQPSFKRHEDCLGFNYYKKGSWSDEVCDLDRSFICQHLVCSK